jgi:hypothetical protein
MYYCLGTLSLAAVIALSTVSLLIPFDILTASPTSQAQAQSQKDREKEAYGLDRQGTQQFQNEQIREASQPFQGLTPVVFCFRTWLFWKSLLVPCR